uniref:DUF4116 domain-containing protein n=1 Tax=viral metagenome TaxID=1070528 RepID=A0A6C0B9E8_9ZZZZ
MSKSVEQVMSDLEKIHGRDKFVTYLEKLSPEMKDSIDFAIALLKFSRGCAIIKYLSPRILNNIEVATAVLYEQPYCLEHFGDEIKDNEDIALLLLDICKPRVFHDLMYNLSDRLKNDKKFMFKVFLKDEREFFSGYVFSILYNEDFVIELLNHNYRVYDKLPEKMQANTNVILKLLSINGTWLHWIPYRLQSNDEFLFAAVKNNYDAIGSMIGRSSKHMPLETKKECIRINYGAIEYFPGLKTDKEFDNPEFKKKSVRKKWETIKYFPELQSDKEFIREIMVHNPVVLTQASSDVKNDKELVFEYAQHVSGEELAATLPLFDEQYQHNLQIIKKIPSELLTPIQKEIIKSAQVDTVEKGLVLKARKPGIPGVTKNIRENIKGFMGGTKRKKKKRKTRRY